MPQPKFILRTELSLNAKLLYGLLLNRSMLAQKNNWADKQGHVYTIYTIRQMAEDIQERRNYDRILEVCVPVHFDGESFRRTGAVENLKKAAAILGR